MYVCMYLSTSTGLSTYISVFIYLFPSQPTLIYTNEMVNLTLTCLHLPGIGLSDTLGAFLAGLLLSETSYRYQIEARLSYIHILNIVLFCLLYVCMYVFQADISPFRGLLLGFFFITVGFSIDTHLIIREVGCHTY